LTLLAYLTIGAIEYDRLKAGEPLLPTLAYLLLLAMLLCWVLSGLAFFLDRYRIPVLIPLVMILYATSNLPGTSADYFYTTMKPVEVGKPERFSDNYFVVVAANGGGIQSAAWTARVLTGLEEECGERCGKEGFAGSIRLISAASGGSVGTMYFVNEYKEERELPENELDGIVRRAKRSSLDQIAWGLLYPDLRRTVIPWSAPESDRGHALEDAWLRRGMEWARVGSDLNREGIERKLSEWHKDAQAGDRPTVIFNTTIAETGEPLPLATTGLPDEMLTHDELFEAGEKKTDVRIVTAARLSAAYPYVSPAARANVQQREKATSHIVDGGYYDNYGISSLATWLDWTLEKEAEKVDKVLIVEIHGARSEPGSSNEDDWICHQPRKSKQGWFYQGRAPAETVLNVRGAGQRAHNEVELDLLKDKWDQKHGVKRVKITRALFEFDDCYPPLSWHLTENQKQKIETEWQDELKNRDDKRAGWNVVENFFDKQAGSTG
jgi:Patatin-like phospholipase